MSRSFTVVMLAGALDPSPLQQQLNLPPLCLPMGWNGTLLDAWLATMGRCSGCTHVRIVVNTEADACVVRQMVDASTAPHPVWPPAVTVIAEPASWRGPGGLVRDLSRDLPQQGIVVAIEAHCLPPPSLEPLLQALDDQTDGAVGAGADAEPAGMYAFDRSVITKIPPLGYFDLKEQLLPALSRHGGRVRLVQITERVIRVRDRSGYLQAVRMSLGAGDRIRRSENATVSTSARIVGSCIIEPGAVIEDGVVIHDSVVLTGAVVQRRAVMSRSITAPFAKVPAASRVIESIVVEGEGVPARGVAGASATGLLHGLGFWPGG